MTEGWGSLQLNRVGHSKTHRALSVMSLIHQEGALVPSPLLAVLSATTPILVSKGTHLFIWAWSCSSLEPSSRGQQPGSS